MFQLSPAMLELKSYCRVHNKAIYHGLALTTIFIAYQSVSCMLGTDSCDGLYMLGPGSGTIRRCGLVGVGVSLWAWA